MKDWQNCTYDALAAFADAFSAYKTWVYAQEFDAEDDTFCELYHVNCLLEACDVEEAYNALNAWYTDGISVTGYDTEALTQACDQLLDCLRDEYGE